MDGVSHLLHGHGAPHHLCGNLWCKMLFMMWTTSLVLGSVGTLDCCSGDATCGDGWSVPSGEGTWGIQKHVCQSVVQNAAYDLYINFGFGVQGHLGMGLVGLSLWGWMECAIWRRDLGYPKHVCQSLVQNAVYDIYINFGFGVLGHLEMGIVGVSLWGWMELAIWSRDRGNQKPVRQSVVQNIPYNMYISFDEGV